MDLISTEPRKWCQLVGVELVHSRGVGMVWRIQSFSSLLQGIERVDKPLFILTSLLAQLEANSGVRHVGGPLQVVR